MLKYFNLLILLLLVSTAFAQKINVSGTVTEEETSQPLEYTTIIITPTNGGNVTGGVTGVDGRFDIEINAGNYDITIEFLSFESKTLNNLDLTKDTYLGTIALNASAEALEEVEGIKVGTRFKSGNAISHAAQKHLMDHPEDYIGKTGEFRFFEATDDGQPRHPTFHGVRLDK